MPAANVCPTCGSNDPKGMGRKCFDREYLCDPECPDLKPDKFHAAAQESKIDPAPCPKCGYNGPGYYQPETHPCVKPTHPDAGELERARWIGRRSTVGFIEMLAKKANRPPKFQVTATAMALFDAAAKAALDLDALVRAEVAAAKREALDALRHQIARNHEPSDACSPCSTGLRLAKRFIDGKEKA